MCLLLFREISYTGNTKLIVCKSDLVPWDRDVKIEISGI